MANTTKTAVEIEWRLFRKNIFPSKEKRIVEVMQ